MAWTFNRKRVYTELKAGQKVYNYTLSARGKHFYEYDYDEVINATGLTIGSVYYVRVYDWYSGAPPTTTFTICVTTPSANAAPVAAFTANTTTITVGGSVIFTNQSTGAPFTAYDWQFAEGASGVCNPATSTLVDKTVQYTVAGTYTVKLKVTNAPTTSET